MIIAQAFNRSESSRDCDFSTCDNDRPLVVQFAANIPDEFAAAAEKVARHGVRVVDLNCGCPQGWAMKDGIGATLLADPDLIASMITAVRTRVPDIHVSIKIRLHKDMDRTLRLIRLAEDAGVAYITVHGRTASERTSIPVQVDAIRRVKEYAHVPIIANGDVFFLKDLEEIVAKTGVDGVMCARGLLANPAMFSGQDYVPLACVVDYLRLAVLYGGPFAIHLHHISYMMDRYLAPPDRRQLHALTSLVAVIEFFQRKHWIGDDWFRSFPSGAASSQRSLLDL